MQSLPMTVISNLIAEATNITGSIFAMLSMRLGLAISCTTLIKFKQSSIQQQYSSHTHDFVLIILWMNKYCMSVQGFV